MTAAAPPLVAETSSFEQQISAGLMIELYPNRLYFTSLGTEPEDTADAMYVGVPLEMIYMPFFADFGPLHLGHVVNYSRLVCEALARCSYDAVEVGVAANTMATTTTRPNSRHSRMRPQVNVVSPQEEADASYWSNRSNNASNNNPNTYPPSSPAASSPPTIRYKKVVLYSPHKAYERANAACLAGCFCVSVLGYSAEHTNRLFSTLYPRFLPFRDASYTVANYNLYLLDCWAGYRRAWDLGWVSTEPWVEMMGVERMEKLTGEAQRAAGLGSVVASTSSSSTATLGTSKKKKTALTIDAFKGLYTIADKKKNKKKASSSSSSTITQDDIDAQFKSVMHAQDPLLPLLLANCLTLYAFDVEAYEFYEKLENGDWNWIVPGQIMAFSSPIDAHPHRNAIAYVPMFREKRVLMVVRLNEKEVYNEKAFLNQGISHLDCNYADGSVPCDAIIERFLGEVVPLLQQTNASGEARINALRAQKVAEIEALQAQIGRGRRGVAASSTADGVMDDSGQSGMLSFSSSSSRPASRNGNGTMMATGGGVGFTSASMTTGRRVVSVTHRPPSPAAAAEGFEALRAKNPHTRNGTDDLRHGASLRSSSAAILGSTSSASSTSTAAHLFSSSATNNAATNGSGGATAAPSAAARGRDIRQNSLGGAVAVHCKAGLGRTGTLISIYLMLHYGFTARECIGWLRICRPGCVLGEQQSFLEQFESRVERARRQQAGRVEQQRREQQKEYVLSMLSGRRMANPMPSVSSSTFLGDGKGVKSSSEGHPLSPAKKAAATGLAPSTAAGNGRLQGLGAALGTDPRLLGLSASLTADAEKLAEADRLAIEAKRAKSANNDYNNNNNGSGAHIFGLPRPSTNSGGGATAVRQKLLGGAHNALLVETNAALPPTMRSATPTTSTTVAMLKSIPKLGNAHLQRLPMNRTTAAAAAVIGDDRSSTVLTTVATTAMTMTSSRTATAVSNKTATTTAPFSSDATTSQRPQTSAAAVAAYTPYGSAHTQFQPSSTFGSVKSVLGELMSSNGYATAQPKKLRLAPPTGSTPAGDWTVSRPGPKKYMNA